MVLFCFLILGTQKVTTTLFRTPANPRRQFSMAVFAFSHTFVPQQICCRRIPVEMYCLLVVKIDNGLNLFSIPQFQQFLLD